MTPDLPTPKLEKWRFTNLPRVIDALACTPLCTTPGCLEAALPVVVGPQVVFHNGVVAPAFSQAFSLAVGATLRTEADTPCAAPLDALDVQAAPETTVITIPQTLALPLHLIYVMSGPPSTCRVRVEVAPGVKLTLVEHHVAAPSFATWQHVGVDLALGACAEIQHVVLQTLPPACVLTRRGRATLADGARVEGYMLQAGGRFSRVEQHAVLGEMCNLTLNGLGLTRHAQVHDVTLTTTLTGVSNTVDVAQRNLVDDAGQAVFQGAFAVQPEAQKTDAAMHVHSLLLSDTAKANHKPELEIFADDVKCTHGAAMGGLDPVQLFYMQARGLTETVARQLLMEGFAAGVVETFPECVRPLAAARLVRFLSENAFTPTTDAEFEPMAEGFMAERSATPFVREVPDDVEVRDV